jgi:hypothetical protein
MIASDDLDFKSKGSRPVVTYSRNVSETLKETTVTSGPSADCRADVQNQGLESTKQNC